MLPRLLLCCVLLASCGPVAGQHRSLDLTGPRGERVYFILGFFNEYLGRRVVEGDDLVETLFCDEAAKIEPFVRQLEQLAHEQQLPATIRRETVQGCLTQVRASALAAALNSLYRKRDGPSIDQSWTTDAAGRRHRLITYWVDEELFRGVPRSLKLAYVAGACARNGNGDSVRFANSQHKAAVLSRLVTELGCTDVRTELSQGFIPQTVTIHFSATAELREWLHRTW